MTQELPGDYSLSRRTSEERGSFDDLRFDTAILYLIFGGILLIMYFLVAWRLNFFSLPDYDYLKSAVYIWYLPFQQLSSIWWKVFLLLPASLLIALFMSFRGIGPKTGRPVYRKGALAFFSLGALLILLFTIHFVLQRTELTDDEITYDLQAKILLKGKLYVQPPVEDSFNNVFILSGDKLTGKYNLGHPLVLAAGMMIGSPYVFPVIFSVLLILMMYFINMLLYQDRRQALLSSFLLFVSPFFYFTGATRLSHTTSTFFLTLFMIVFLRLKEQDRRISREISLALIAGLSAGFAFNVRPLTAVGFLFPFLILSLSEFIRKKGQHLIRYLSIGLGFAAVIIFSLWYNKQITGSYFTFPFTHYNPNEQLLSSHYDLAGALCNLAMNAVKMNSFLFGFPLSLLFIFLYVFKNHKSAPDKLCFTIIGSFCVFYLSYYGPGVSDTGPLYYYELLIPIIILSARGLLWLHDLLKAMTPKIKALAANFLLISVVLSLPTFWFERSLHLMNLTNAISEPYRVIENSRIHHAVVFIQSWPNKGFVYGFRNNSPDFTDDVILCRLRKGEDNLRVATRFSNREYYILRYNISANRSELSQASIDELGKIE